MDEIEFDEHVEDDVLRLMFAACHPVLARDGRVALTLKLVGGLSDRADRPGLPGADADDGSSDHPGEEGAAPRRRCPSRCRSETRSTRPAVLRARGRLSHLQRGIRGDGGPVVDAARAVRRGHAARAHAGRAGRRESPRRTASWRSWRSRPRACHARSGPKRRAGHPARPGPRPLGPPAHHTRPERAGARPCAGRRCGGRGPVPAPGRARRLSRPGCGGGGHRLGPDRHAVRRCSPGGARHRSSSSTAPWRCRWPTGRRRRCRSSMRSASDPALRGYHLLPSVRADLLRQARPYGRGTRGVSRAPPGSPPTSASATTCSPAPRTSAEAEDDDAAAHHPYEEWRSRLPQPG